MIFGFSPPIPVSLGASQSFFAYCRCFVWNWMGLLNTFFIAMDHLTGAP